MCEQDGLEIIGPKTPSIESNELITPPINTASNSVEIEAAPHANSRYNWDDEIIGTIRDDIQDGIQGG